MDVRFCRIIFALYSLIRKYGAWLVIPAMLGGAAFLADSVLTPAVSISSAVEGLKTLPALEHLFTGVRMFFWTVRRPVQDFCGIARGSSSPVTS